MVISHETPQSQEFLKSTITWISLIFSKSRDLILISLDRIHYYQVLDRIPWHNDHSHVCGGYLRSTAESSEILCKIGHDLTMIYRDIYVTTPVPFYVKFQFFMCWLFISFKQVEKWWDFDRLWSICGHRLKTWRLTEFSRKNARFWSEFGSRFSSTHSTGGIKIGLTLKFDILTHRKVMDKPFWGLAKLVTKF